MSEDQKLTGKKESVLEKLARLDAKYAGVHGYEGGYFRKGHEAENVYLEEQLDPLANLKAQFTQEN